MCVCIFITKYCKARRLLDGFSCSPRREKEIKPVGKRRHQLTSYLGREREKKKKKSGKREAFLIYHTTQHIERSAFTRESKVVVVVGGLSRFQYEISII